MQKKFLSQQFEIIILCRERAESQSIKILILTKQLAEKAIGPTSFEIAQTHGFNVSVALVSSSKLSWVQCFGAIGSDKNMFRCHWFRTMFRCHGFSLRSEEGAFLVAAQVGCGPSREARVTMPGGQAAALCDAGGGRACGAAVW